MRRRRRATRPRSPPRRRGRPSPGSAARWRGGALHRRRTSRSRPDRRSADRQRRARVSPLPPTERLHCSPKPPDRAPQARPGQWPSGPPPRPPRQRSLSDTVPGPGNRKQVWPKIWLGGAGCRRAGELAQVLLEALAPDDPVEDRLLVLVALALAGVLPGLAHRAAAEELGPGLAVLDASRRPSRRAPGFSQIRARRISGRGPASLGSKNGTSLQAGTRLAISSEWSLPSRRCSGVRSKAARTKAGVAQAE